MFQQQQQHCKHLFFLVFPTINSVCTVSCIMIIIINIADQDSHSFRLSELWLINMYKLWMKSTESATTFSNRNQADHLWCCNKLRIRQLSVMTQIRGKAVVRFLRSYLKTISLRDNRCKLSACKAKYEWDCPLDNE